MRAIIYCRKSTESSERQVQSLEAQENWAMEYCKLHNFEIVEKIIESKTAKKPWREGFNKMMTLFSENKADVIVCWQLNRLSRNAIDEWLIKWFSQQWIIKEIHSTDGISNGQNILLMSVHFWMSNQYIIDLKKNVERGMLQKVKKWGIVQKAPFGYKNNRNTADVEIDQKEAEIVKEIFKMRCRNVPFEEIGKKVFLLGGKSRFWNPLSRASIERIIKNEFYIGIMRWKWEKFPWSFTPIISKELFDEANRDVVVYGSRDTSIENGFYFKGKIFFEWEAMSAYETKNNVYYKSKTGQKIPFNISQNEILKLLEWEMKKYNFPIEFQGVIRESLQEYMKDIFKESKKIFTQHTKSLEEIRERKSRLLDVRLSGILSDEDFKKKQEELEEKASYIQERIKDLNYSETYISEESVELLEILCGLEKAYLNWGKRLRGSICDFIFVELHINNKKELELKENKLFEIIKNLNQSIWWGNQYAVRTHMFALIRYIQNLEKVNEMRERIQELQKI